MPLHLPWPLPAVLAWALCWLVYRLGEWLGLAPGAALLLAVLGGLLQSLAASSWWRRVIVAAGFPLAVWVSGAAVVPGWLWLVLMLAALLVYPVRAWRDAPLFPTPADALAGLPPLLALPPGARVLDAGCGLGHGLRALRAAFPLARLHGVEWSWPLRLWCGLRCPWALVRRGDLWQHDWQPYALVYLFQRPESMPRAAAKAQSEMRPGSWLVSLEFEAREWQADHVLRLADDRPVWAYRLPLRPRSGSALPVPASQDESAPRSLRSLPPEGAVSAFGTAGRHWMSPPRSLRSLPPEGAVSAFGTAGRH